MRAPTSLVTGGAGFIGSNLVDALLARGDQVVVVDNLTTGRRTNLDQAIGLGAELVDVDVRDFPSVLKVFEEHRPSTVFHLAAQIDVRLSVADPGFDATVNIAGTANLLEANRTTSNARFVLASTGGAIYGEGSERELPLPEETPARPLSPYGQSKFAAEGYLSLYRQLHGSDCVALRFGNVYGPRQDPLGEA
ncbi:MAG: GDP-mannose 4,6-dehydratase, partial [Solirubrobacterales bacterium]|nr:GDP-mannose 4,6-dehydratase [Solirubrobacterales bacterium]